MTVRFRQRLPDPASGRPVALVEGVDYRFGYNNEHQHHPFDAHRRRLGKTNSTYVIRMVDSHRCDHFRD